ncbi:MAG: DUF2339 domain-containing protein [Pseudomonadota bacterium]
MEFLFVLIGLGALIGVPVAAIVALVRSSSLRARVEILERRVEALSQAAAQGRKDEAQVATAEVAGNLAAPASAPRTASAEGQSLAPATSPQPAAAEAPAPAPGAGVAPPPAPPAVRPARASSASSGAKTRGGKDPRPEPDWFESAWARMRGWFTEGNVPVKVGMVVLFAGVGALLKYATDQGWMSFPIQFRLLGIAAVALVGLAFGYRQRHARRAFSLSLQGGALGVLLMTSFAAFKLYGLMGPGAAFAAWVLLAAAAGLLAVWQDARALAVLGILAGFLAPVLMSTGAGSHVALFSFYAVLNAAIFAIAWLRWWRELNLLGFAFTFGIGTLWGIERYTPAMLGSTLPFLALFFAFYVAIPLLHARRAAARDGDVIEASLVFGTPLVAFAQLAGLLEGDRYPLAATALGLSALYVLLALRPDGGRTPLLRSAHRVLAVGFATLAVPLALSARGTAAVFALEGAALVWFGVAQARPLSRWAGAVLQAVAAAVLLGTLGRDTGATPVANAAFMGAFLLALAGFASAWVNARAGRGAARTWYLWALAWWLVMGHREIGEFVPGRNAADAHLAFLALTAALAGLALRGGRSRLLGWTIPATLAAGLPLAFWQAVSHLHPLQGTGLAAWIAYAALGAFALASLRGQGRAPAGCAQAVWLLSLTLALSLWLTCIADRAQLAPGWQYAGLALPWLLTGAALHFRPQVIGWPLGSRIREWLAPLMSLWMLILALGGFALLFAAGDAAPLPWIPLLNPVELVLTGLLALLVAWYFGEEAPPLVRPLRAPVLAVAVLAVLTSATLRAVHQLGGLPWDMRLFDTALAQASLSLVWSVLGVVGWVAGSRRRQRELWLAGAVLMGVVLAKLVLVDRMHLGNLPGIASFIGYGLLCTVVGYLAPAPPREAAR